MAPPPVRIAIIGLSQHATTSWASLAHLPSLLTNAGRQRFQIVALCNSSVASAEAAIRVYGLDPATVKAYGSPADLAADPDVDVVLCATRVDTHYATALPSIEAGKDVLIEWPIAANPSETQRLVAAAKKHSGSSTVFVGVQRRYAPAVRKVKALLEAGAIGQLLNVQVNAHGADMSPGRWPAGLKYFAQRAVGGNPITIGVGHLLDAVESAAGDIVPGTIHAHSQLQTPGIAIFDPATGEVTETVTSDVPDLLSLHGLLAPRTHSKEPATLTFQYQSGYPFPGQPALDWTLTGAAGKIRVVDPSGIYFQESGKVRVGEDEGPCEVTIRLHRAGADAAETVPWEYSAVQKEVPVAGRSMQTLLYAYADAKRGVGPDVRRSSDWPDLERTAARAYEIDRWMGVDEN
ncbi:oxidoreductase [Sporothrix brasiliensis 5110]|uniref:Oxidoreductase n=1 Tax=Sporothrix brasiliensis 5110 TaxID=1398154 RepID=A0A0C2F379_9PEZI|nr:oxidoreductase [Sporothrix brasiliensis 5110]KIH93339.1 oxidoreductase [Sporothrix brasiliensis 5110]